MDVEPARIAKENWISNKTSCYLAGWDSPEGDGLAMANVTFYPGYDYDSNCSMYTERGKLID